MVGKRLRGTAEVPTPKALELVSKLVVASPEAPPIDALAVVAGLSLDQQLAASHLQTAVVYARSQGASWSAIGQAVGVTEQAAYKRFRNVVAVTSDDVTVSTTTEDRRLWVGAAELVASWWNEAQSPGRRHAGRLAATNVPAPAAPSPSSKSSPARSARKSVTPKASKAKS